ncbi:MAG TPA: flagellar brake domain-containing protein [Pararobbsia sp.]|nr:flagellar brake domain-containing protein [Pararobbsia sp.]
MILTDLFPSDIEPGQPLRHSVFDRDKKLLLSKGNIVNAALYDKLLRLGAYKLTLDTDAHSDAGPAVGRIRLPHDAPANAVGMFDPVAQADSGTVSQRDDLQSDENVTRATTRADDAASPPAGQLAPAQRAEPLTPAAWRTCVAVGPTHRAPVRSLTTPAELFDRWLDFMHITDSANGDAVSCRLSLLGVIDHTCLMVTSATLERDWASMHAGRQFTATVFDGRRIYTFTTTIVSRFQQPFRYLHLSFPDVLAERPPRRTLRASVELEAVLMHDGEQARESTSVMITNLSTKSAGVRTTNLRLAVGAPVLLVFTLHAQEGDAMPVRVPAVVRRQSIDAQHAVATYGLEFVDVPAQVRSYLETYVALSARLL